jgi:hypothetical protein
MDWQQKAEQLQTIGGTQPWLKAAARHASFRQ